MQFQMSNLNTKSFIFDLSQCNNAICILNKVDMDILYIAIEPFGVDVSRCSLVILLSNMKYFDISEGLFESHYYNYSCNDFIGEAPNKSITLNPKDFKFKEHLLLNSKDLDTEKLGVMTFLRNNISIFEPFLEKELKFLKKDDFI